MVSLVKIDVFFGEALKIAWRLSCQYYLSIDLQEIYSGKIKSLVFNYLILMTVVYPPVFCSVWFLKQQSQEIKYITFSNSKLAGQYTSLQNFAGVSYGT